MDDDGNTLRILVATDNHLGVWEKDDVRQEDSFTTFDEIFEIAEQQGADMVLLGGDLFHDNKPSRQTVIKAMDVLTRRCLGDRPVALEILSDQRQNFTTGRVNFSNPNYNVSLPVFTIHGNHDDPGGQDNLSAVDIMSTANLVNYFGKQGISGEGTGKVHIAPVLMRKGDTRLALYGLGNLRDERLARLFNTPNCVQWACPAATPDVGPTDWFNLFVLHQNRVAHTASTKNCIREAHLAKFLDLVIWGHEHECLAEPWPTVGGGNFSVLQPGSSVATALSEGEARRKHVVLLEVRAQDWRAIKLPLETVRPFAFDSVALTGQLDLDPEDPEGVVAFLEEKVASMIAAATRTRPARAPELPLIRLRVDYSGFSTINTQRFGQKFVGKVANPHDIILWQKAPVRRTKDGDKEAGTAKGGAVRPEALDESRIEDLIATHLRTNLEILPEAELTGALHEFVEKDNKKALEDAVGRVLAETQKDVAEKAGGGGGGSTLGQPPTFKDEDSTKAGGGAAGEDFAAAIAEAAKQRNIAAESAATLRRADKALKAEAGEDGAGASGAAAAAGTSSAQPSGKPPRPRGAAAAGGTSRTKQATLGAFSPTGGRSQLGVRRASPGSVPAAPRTGSKRPAAAAATKKLSAYKGAASSEFDSGDDDVREADLMEEESEDGDVDEIQDSDDELEEEEVVRPTAPKRGRRTVGGTQPKRGGGGSSQEVIVLDDSDDEEEALESSAKGRRQAGPRPVARSQPFGRLGTGSQQAGRGGGGWGSLKK